MENENYIKSCYEEGASRASDIAKNLEIRQRKGWFFSVKFIK
jgi:hypothetical protein